MSEEKRKAARLTRKHRRRAKAHGLTLSHYLARIDSDLHWHRIRKAIGTMPYLYYRTQAYEYMVKPIKRVRVHELKQYRQVQVEILDLVGFKTLPDASVLDLSNPVRSKGESLIVDYKSLHCAQGYHPYTVADVSILLEHLLAELRKSSSSWLQNADAIRRVEGLYHKWSNIKKEYSK